MVDESDPAPEPERPPPQDAPDASFWEKLATAPYGVWQKMLAPYWDQPATPEARMGRDPEFWSVMGPVMQSAGVPAAGLIPDPETGTTGRLATPYERAVMLAQWFGNALPFRGAMGQGDPALRAFLKRQAAHLTDQAGSAEAAAQAPRMGPAQFPTIDPGGWQSASPVTARTLERELQQPLLGRPNPEVPARLNERQRTRELENLEQIMAPKPGSPIGPAPAPYGPGGEATPRPWGTGVAYDWWQQLLRRGIPKPPKEPS